MSVIFQYDARPQAMQANVYENENLLYIKYVCLSTDIRVVEKLNVKLFEMRNFQKNEKNTNDGAANAHPSMLLLI